MSSSDQHCVHCKFYLAGNGDKDTGVCGRFPPVPSPLWGSHPITKQPTLLGVAALRPEVHNEGTCGEWAIDLTKKISASVTPIKAVPTPPKLIL